MSFILSFTDTAIENLRELKNDKGKLRGFKVVKKALKYLEIDPNYPSLHTHPFHSQQGPGGEKLFECYAQNKTPNAYQIFFIYGPERNEITIISIIPHP